MSMPPGKGLWYTAAKNYKRVFFFQLVWFFFLFNSFELYICKIFYVYVLLKKLGTPYIALFVL